MGSKENITGWRRRGGSKLRTKTPATTGQRALAKNVHWVGFKISKWLARPGWMRDGDGFRPRLGAGAKAWPRPIRATPTPLALPNPLGVATRGRGNIVRQEHGQG
eukprot:6704628-Pyramimonas_sp.AAC.1